MVRTFIGGRPPRNETDEQEDTQVFEPGLNDFRPMPRNLFVGGAEQEHLSETDDERTPTGYATQPEQFQVPTGTRQRPSRPHYSQHERPERSTEPARTTELEERTRVLEMAMGRILARLIPDDPLIPLLNRDAQPAAVVATQNSPALSNIIVPTMPRGSGKLNIEPSSSKHSEELMRKNADLERQLQDVQKSIDELKSPRSHQQTLDLDSAPLNLSITAEPYQEGFKIPHLETYDGSGDPNEHLHTYQAIMRIQNANDAMMCKVFPATLKSTARRWYHKLPRHSIDSYSQLAKLFSNKFASQREIKRTATELMQVHQKEGESSRDYMQRFNKATLDIDNVPDTICLSALLHGLKRGRFLDDLLENPPKTWNEVNDRSASFILSEDFQSSKRRADDKQSKGQEQLLRREDKKKQKVNEPWGKPAEFPKYANYVPLTLPRRLPALKGRAGVLSSHGEIRGVCPEASHPANSSNPLRAGLRPTSGAEDQRPAAQSQKDRRGVGCTAIPPPFGTINMISGGMHSGGQSARARKAYARQVMTVNKNRPLKRPFEEAEWENTPITFSPADYKRADEEPDVMMPHADPFVAMLNPSSLQKHEGPIYGFNNQPVPVEGVITLPIYVGSEPRFRMASITFLVVKMESAFNAILGRATLCKLKAVISQPHLCMKFPTPQGVGVLKGNQKMARACYQDTFKKVELTVAPRGSENSKPTQPGQQTMSISDIEHRPEGVEQKAEPVEPVETVPLNPDVTERTVKIGTKLTKEERAELLEFLRVNQDVFAWTTDEMLGIPAELTVHKLSTDPTRRPVVQKRRLFGPEKQAAIDEEMRKLLQAGFIRRVEYSEWVSNPVLVKKPNGKWRMCIDFTNLNDACPKDPHPLPNVEKLVERAAGHEWMSFLDASSGYHQVQLQLNDQEKNAFYAGDAIYCYVMMPFGLKNAGATYQKLVQIIFKLQIGRNIEVYVDDMIVTRKFLGYVVSKKGIEVNPEKVQAVQQMEPPKTIKDVQRLTGRIAALHRFIARSAEKCLPFFKALREPKNFHWTAECQQAFDELKQYLASAPLLSKPVEGECFYLYLGVTEEAVSSVLLREENKNQKPICYVSKVLQGAEQNYPLTEKAAFALVCTAQLSGRLIGWSIELSEYDLKFQPRTAIKGQAVVDFLVECAPAAVREKAPEHPMWVLYVDGAANVEGSGAGAVLLGPDSFKSEHALRFKFQTTNNAVEYEALIYGLKLASKLKVQNIQVFSDSQLVVGQVNGSCDIRDPQLGRYASVVNRLKSAFVLFQIDKIPRADNHRADELSKLASSQDLNPQRSTIVEILDAPSYTDSTVKCQLLSTDPSASSWTTPLINYLQSGELPEDQATAKLVKRRAAHFTLLNNQLYKRAASMPLLRCLTPYEAEYAVREVHEGVCGTHIGSRTLARKLLRHGYYWPTMVENAQSYVKKCPTCQFNADDIHMPGITACCKVHANFAFDCMLSISTFVKAGEMLSSLTSPWPFAQWGVDLLGPFIKGKGGCTFLVVAVDYFTKWIEAKPLSMTTERKIEEFLFNSILCRFGIPKRIIVDNGPQFRAAALRSFCKDYGIELSLTSVYTPQSNGQAESANKIVLRGLRTRVIFARSNWVDELNKILWSCCTTPSSATGETPFNLAYGAEAVIPVEVGLSSVRSDRHDDQINGQLLRENLDLVEEVREMARIRNMAHQGSVARFYNKRVRARQFQVGDLVLRKAELTNTCSHMGKLAPNWEGPYMVAQVNRPGSYVLAYLNGRQLPFTWNV
ncbi:hypothetical protein SLEP1_g54871 [Rubroshorea leprosula]|uniref:Uncharacterized protein n=1 Tax=Rubroshorea leprosula TaxID=152421 RepID=A0AAV5MEX7_9ROSI|nr:hypothetical protein SLEP1_g54871 [Rubroshorea leprosula]